MFPNAPPSNRRKPREVDSFPDWMRVSLATANKFDTTSKGIYECLIKNNWPGKMLSFPVGPETFLSNKRFWGWQVEQQERPSYSKWTNPESHFFCRPQMTLTCPETLQQVGRPSMGDAATINGQFQTPLCPLVPKMLFSCSETLRHLGLPIQDSTTSLSLQGHLRPSLGKPLPPSEAVSWWRDSRGPSDSR